MKIAWNVVWIFIRCKPRKDFFCLQYQQAGRLKKGGNRQFFIGCILSV